MLTTRLAHAGYALLAVGAGVAAGHLAASLIDPATSPVVAIASEVIDQTPTPVKEWAVARFGTSDKPLLIGSIIAVLAVAAAAVGAVGATRPRAAFGAATALVTVGGTITLARPETGTGALVAVLVTAAVGLATLWLLPRLHPRPWSTDQAQATPPGSGPETHPESGLEAGVGATLGTDEGDVGRRALGTRVQRRWTGTGAGPIRAGRRTVLVAAGAVAALATLAATGGQAVIRAKNKLVDVALPAAPSPLPAPPPGLEDTVTGVTPLVTSNTDFYRVDTRITLPTVDPDEWTLTIDGDLGPNARTNEAGEVVLTFTDLLDLGVIERDITLTCVSNSVGGPYAGGARWLGVPLDAVLTQAGIATDERGQVTGTTADQILSTDVDGMTISTPLAVALDGRDALIAVGMNGTPLPREHGFPARMVISGLYGFISATKWVTRLTLTRYDDVDAYWTERGWATQAPIKPSARIDTPRALSRVAAGTVPVGGVAWAQDDGGVDAVEISIDGNAWVEATLGPDLGTAYWRQWHYDWAATPGSHRIAARVRTRDGGIQTDERAEPFPDGASGIQQLTFTVE